MSTFEEILFALGATILLGLELNKRVFCKIGLQFSLSVLFLGTRQRTATWTQGKHRQSLKLRRELDSPSAVMRFAVLTLKADEVSIPHH